MRSLSGISILSAAAIAALAALYILTHGVAPKAQAADGFSPAALTIGDRLTSERWDAF